MGRALHPAPAILFFLVVRRRHSRDEPCLLRPRQILATIAHMYSVPIHPSTIQFPRTRFVIHPLAPCWTIVRLQGVWFPANRPCIGQCAANSPLFSSYLYEAGCLRMRLAMGRHQRWHKGAGQWGTEQRMQGIRACPLGGSTFVRLWRLTDCLGDWTTVWSGGFRGWPNSCFQKQKNLLDCF